MGVNAAPMILSMPDWIIKGEGGGLVFGSTSVHSLAILLHAEM